MLIEKSDIVVLAIKPKDVAESIDTIKAYIRPHHLVLSVLAGVSTATIVNLFDQEVAVVRAMPNTSASIGLSATAIASGRFATAEHMNVTTALFETIGTVTTVEEEATSCCNRTIWRRPSVCLLSSRSNGKSG